MSVVVDQLGDYKIGKTIGAGAFSKVKLAVHLPSGQKFAVKIIDKVLMQEKRNHCKKVHDDRARRKVAEERNLVEVGRWALLSPDYEPRGPAVKSEISEKLDSRPPLESSHKIGSDTLLEVKLMMRLDHPNVVKVYQIFESKTECYVVMEYASGGEMIEYINRDNHLSEGEGRRLFRELISAIDHFHQANVVHRDLKLENILLSGGKSILITDFGLGRTFNEPDDIMSSFCGTPNYAAIELISGIPYSGVKTDIWAMGVVLYIMMAGHPPFKGTTITQIYNNIKLLKYKIPHHFSTGLVQLLESILVKNPEKRIDMEGLRTHPWVNADSDGGPARISPRFSGKIDDAVLSNTISGIRRDDAFTVITIRKPGEPQEHSLSKSSFGLHRRMQSNPFSNAWPIKEAADKDVIGLPKLPKKKDLDQPLVAQKKRTASAPYRQPLIQIIPQSRTILEPDGQETTASPVSFAPPSFTSSRAPNKSAPTVAEERGDATIAPSVILINPAPKSIRTIQMSFRKGAIAKSLAPGRLLSDLYDALESMKKSLPFKMSFSRATEFHLFNCVYSHGEGTVVFEAEIGKVWILQQYGVQTKRIIGNAIVYQSLVTTLLSSLRW